MKNITYPEAFEEIWNKEIELKSRLSNRLFCLGFMICNPASSIAYYLSGDPFFYTLLPTHLLSSCVILLYLFLHHRKVISGQQLSFFTFATLIFFYAFLLSRPHLSYVQSSLNLTLAVIFTGLVVRWQVRYALICAAMAVVLFPLSIHFASAIPLTRFFEDGGLFVLAANVFFPVVVHLSYNKDKLEFFYRYTLEEKNQQLECQKTIAENATRAKSNFLSMMSHEIRTPLNGIVGMVHLLMQDDDTRNKSGELLQTLKFSADHLMAVVNDVLDLNKINSNHVVLDSRPFATVFLLENLRKTFLPKAEEKGIALIFDIDKNLPVQLIADKVRLNQIFTNLIHNAIKFTHSGSVTFAVKELSRRPKEVELRFEVIDTGIGIALAEQEDIFEFFIQAKPKVLKENTGTGLGLAICRELLRLFDSEIRLESEEGKGSSFSFILKLPYSNELIQTDAAPEKFTAISTKTELRVLVVDDNKTNVVLATQLLKRRNILFDIAVNGKEAFNLFKTNRYDLILMDLLMPVMDGFESTALIRQIDTEIPIIALTASAFENEKERAMESGFSGYLTKPFIPADFYKYILPFLGIQTTGIS